MIIHKNSFKNTWEQRKLGEVVTINPKTELPDEFKYVDLESVVGTNLLGFQVVKKENAPSRAQRLASYGDVFYQTVRPYQRNNYLFEDVDKDMVFSTGYAQLRSKLDSYFLLTLVQNDNFVKVVLDNCTGTSYPAINGSELGKITVQIPSNEAEANQIGKVFRGIDKSITLHQRKLEHLNSKKKALLQKLFPKNGERYPELRFPGFTDAWEQRKADYIFKSITDKGYPDLPVLSASQELGMVYRDQNGIDIQHDKKNETLYKRVLPGQFVIHLRSFQGGFAYSEVEGITSPAYTVMSFKNSSEQYGLFWKHVFKSETFIKRLETITYGIRDGRSISFSDFKSLILQYPSFSEQKLIGDSIAIIERGITLHQRKLDHLQLQKKALLQQMFV